MASKARNAFDENAKDIKRLIDIHNRVGGASRGRRFHIEVLNKSAIVLITSYWEAYCEDIAAEGLAHIVNHANSANAIPKDLKKKIATELKNDTKNELGVWLLADGGWKIFLNDRLEKLREERNWNLNAPKSDKLDDLFAKAIGIAKISDSWKWKRMPPADAKDKLDKYVKLRGEIAHRGKTSGSVTKDQVIDYFDFIKQLASKTGGAVNKYVRDITGVPLY